MENLKKLSRAEMRNIAGGTFGCLPQCTNLCNVDSDCTTGDKTCATVGCPGNPGCTMKICLQ
ncbi:bacteriocin-like protein [Mucilaginibacter phenanthrenivorans]|uniref:bacteriocin-like protein n=1 Tax=Mucilaginibacter phenanthrenivorans TaxID=1234842 RepID=UPI004035B52D